jgi:branched-subunit amino acid transport protein
MLANVALGVFQWHVQTNLSLRKFIVAVLLFLPYGYLAYLFEKSVLQNAGKEKGIYILQCLLGMPGMAVYLLTGDYSRVIFYGFVYYILLTVLMVVMGDKNIIKALHVVVIKVQQWVAVPAVVIAYPFLVMTFWISGPLTLFEEVFVGL